MQFYAYLRKRSYWQHIFCPGACQQKALSFVSTAVTFFVSASVTQRLSLYSSLLQCATLCICSFFHYSMLVLHKVAVWHTFFCTSYRMPCISVCFVHVSYCILTLYLLFHPKQQETSGSLLMTNWSSRPTSPLSPGRAVLHYTLFRPYLTQYATQLLVQTLVSSRLDYCNALLTGLLACVVKPLQMIQNAAARLVFN